MDDEALIEIVAGDLLTYVLEGTLPEDELAGILKPIDFPDQYAEYDRLITLHFLLQDRVQRFADRLPQAIRTIKTETTAESNLQRGGIDGRIDWEETYKRRSTTSPGDRSVYVVTTQAEEYDIPENIVLKELVDLMQEGIGDIDRFLQDSKSWIDGTWLGEPQRRDRFQTTVKRNVHLQRIPDPSPAEPTPRMVTRAHQSRKPLYQTAATLYEDWQAYRNSPEAVAALLKQTTITPGENTLFELFVLFSVIDALRSVEAPEIGRPTYQTIESGRSAAATFDGASDLKVFYEQAPTDPDIDFLPQAGSPPSRADLVHEMSQEVGDAYFTETDRQTRTKRPDVTVVASEEDSATARYLVIEIKRSQTKKRIKKGITELLEYLTFLRETDYAFSPGEYGSGLNGLLVVQDIAADDIVPASLAQQSAADLPIRIIQASDLRAVLPSVVRRLFVNDDNEQSASG